MKNISIKNIQEQPNLDRKIALRNGSVVIHKKKGQVIGVYLVISFRDNKNRYQGCTTHHCTLVDMDTGQLAFEERCSRRTTERRVLRHLLRAGYSQPYNPDSCEQDYLFEGMEVHVYPNGNYKINLELGEELIADEREY